DHIAAGVLALAQVLAVVVTFGLKALFARARPMLDTGFPLPESAAFPSGHAVGTAMVFMLLAVLLFEENRAARPWAEGVAIGLALVTGLTRLILGVHWPTDVVAGWGLGWGLAGTFLLLRAYLERKKTLPHLAPNQEVAHTVGLCLPQGIHIHDETGILVHVEDVPKLRPRTAGPHPLHAQELGLVVQGFVARKHGPKSLSGDI
ncbi:MAG: phosphatase PAP2 family protein, partial [Candidatus Thermoplasmatota archaeon]|nr:phosphatase PAP2 family protein [Candidatus Thermoplasmatota archaeon]